MLVNVYEDSPGKVTPSLAYLC